MKIITNLIEAHIFRETENGIEFLLLKRSENVIYPGLWQMVNGKIEKDNANGTGEKAFETALREIKEETGLIPKKIWAAPKVNSFYSSVDDSVWIVPVFAALVSKNSKVKISEEHTEYKWLKPAQAKKLLVWEEQRKAVDIITQYFTKEIKHLNFVEIK